MKIERVAVHNRSFTSDNAFDKNNVYNPFLYTANEEYKPKFSFKEHRSNYIAGILALGVAVASLKKFIGRKSISKDVVELADKTLGLNKIKGCKRTVMQLKDKILYPMKALLLGDQKVLRNDFKTGLIIADANPEKSKQLSEALIEHAENIGIHCIGIASPRRKNRIKEVHKALDAAINYHKYSGKSVIVNIGDLGSISNLKVAKTESASNLEKRLAQIPKGVLWSAWTTAVDKLPYFYNNIPTLSVKLID